MTPLDVSCPVCRARKGKPCVYLWPKDGDGNPRARRRWLSPGVLALMDRAGTPTKRPHNDRYRKALLTEKVAARRAREAEQAARLGPREEILRANARAVMDEQRVLVAWLREHAYVLAGASSHRT